VGGPDNLVVTPAIPIEDIASSTAFTEGHPTVVGFLPSREKPTEFQERVGRFAVDPGGDRRIHELTISIVFAAGEVTNVPFALELLAQSRGESAAVVVARGGRTPSLAPPPCGGARFADAHSCIRAARAIAR
jgi:hypothetical protein